MRLPLVTLLLLTFVSGCAGSRTSTTPGVMLAPNLILHLKTAPFDVSDYDVIRDESGVVTGTTNCETWHGVDGGVPEIVIMSGWVMRDGQRLDLDTSCMGSYDPGPDYRNEGVGSFEADPLAEPGSWTISGTISDGAGTAEVVWTVGPNSTSRDRLVSGPALFD